jgi:hypothetical protein
MSSAHWSASQFWWLHRLFARAIDLWPRNSGPMKCPGILWWQHVASFYLSDHSQLVLRLQAHKRSPNHPMQWTRDEAQWCGQSSGREPLIGAVRQQEAQSQSRGGITPIVMVAVACRLRKAKANRPMVRSMNCSVLNRGLRPGSFPRSFQLETACPRSLVARGRGPQLWKAWYRSICQACDGVSR